MATELREKWTPLLLHRNSDPFSHPFVIALPLPNTRMPENVTSPQWPLLPPTLRRQDATTGFDLWQRPEQYLCTLCLSPCKMPDIFGYCSRCARWSTPSTPSSSSLTRFRSVSLSDNFKYADYSQINSSPSWQVNNHFKLVMAELSDLSETISRCTYNIEYIARFCPTTVAIYSGTSRQLLRSVHVHSTAVLP